MKNTFNKNTLFQLYQHIKIKQGN